MIFDKERFEIIASSFRKQNSTKIGTLSEKRLHLVLKKYFCDDETKHEVKLGPYFLDIFNDEIIEIQTRSMNKLRNKLDYFLDDYKVTIVYPIAHTKWMQWIDESTGEVTKRRKSPKCGKYLDAIKELYKIKMYLQHPNLAIHLMLIDMDEFRNLDGWSKDKKKGSSRNERLPLALYDAITIKKPKDFLKLFPILPCEFSANDFAKSAKIPLHYAQTAMTIFSYLDIITLVRKEGRKHIYQIK